MRFAKEIDAAATVKDATWRRVRTTTVTREAMEIQS